MIIQIFSRLAPAALVMGLAWAMPATAAPQDTMNGVQYAQFNRQYDRDRGDRGDRYNGPDQRDNNYGPGGNYGPGPGGGPTGRNGLWRAGDVLPGQALNVIVYDWEERGLMRPPGGHNWVRVGQQFLLVRFSDRMISRILNFN